MCPIHRGVVLKIVTLLRNKGSQYVVYRFAVRDTAIWLILCRVQQQDLKVRAAVWSAHDTSLHDFVTVSSSGTLINWLYVRKLYPRSSVASCRILQVPRGWYGLFLIFVCAVIDEHALAHSLTLLLYLSSPPRPLILNTSTGTIFFCQLCGARSSSCCIRC